jgi:hypothetical protein
LAVATDRPQKSRGFAKLFTTAPMLPPRGTRGSIQDSRARSSLILRSACPDENSFSNRTTEVLEKNGRHGASTGTRNYWSPWVVFIARAVLERAASLDPFDIEAHIDSGLLAAWLGNIEVARDRFQELRARAPLFGVAHVALLTELWFGDPSVAKSMLAQIDPQGRRNLPINWSCLTSLIEARASQSHLSEAQIESACTGNSRNLAPTTTYLLFGYFGYVDETFRAIQGSTDRIDSGIRFLFVPQLRAVRADPRFMPLAAHLGLVDYWLDTEQWPDFCTEEKLPYDCKEAALAALAENNSGKAQSVSTTSP